MQISAVESLFQSPQFAHCNLSYGALQSGGTKASLMRGKREREREREREG